MERHEPLKEKIAIWFQNTGNISKSEIVDGLLVAGEGNKTIKLLFYEDVKSAVQGLLEDVRARIPHRNCDCDVCMKLNWVIDDIKKWLPDVVEDENKKGDDNAGN